MYILNIGIFTISDAHVDCYNDAYVVLDISSRTGDLYGSFGKYGLAVVLRCILSLFVIILSKFALN